ncbi:MAG: alpha/beta hydrolase [Pseudomonadota bacterium]
MISNPKKKNARTKTNFGWRLNLMFGLVDFFTLIGLIPPITEVTRWPMKKRQSMKLGGAMIHPPLPSSVKITEETISPLNAEPFAVRIFTPTVVDASRPTVLFMHGGGWIAGGMASMDYLCSNVADGVAARVISVEYRLAPEFPFPAGLEDSYAALSWLAQNNSSASGIAVMGDSAGGNLAAALCILSKQRGGPRIVHQTLIYPVLDATLQSDSMNTYTGGGLKRHELVGMVAHYLQGKVSPENPLVSPLLASDVSGLPPAFVLTADADPLRDEGKLYADKLSAAGIAVRYLNVLDAPHGFVALPKLCKATAGTVKEIISELRAVKSS